jgi:hypothetical protein
MSEMPSVYRPPIDGDTNFILSSWLKSFRQSPSARNLDNTTYFNAHKKHVQRTLTNSLITMIVSPEDANEILGYAVFTHNPNVLHYIYIKSFARQLHLATDLIATLFPPGSEVIITHKNKNTPHISKHHTFHFYPYL